MPSAYLFDLDGTIYQNNAAIPGAVELIHQLKQQGIPYRFLTNTTSKSRAAIHARLRSYGIPAENYEVFTALVAGAELARGLGCRRLLPLVPEEALEDLDGFELVGGTSPAGQGRPAYERQAHDSDAVQAVLVGDLADDWTFDLLQQAFTALRSGARLIALARDRYWMTERGLTLDSGPFVVALEFAAEVESLIAGKPSAAFFDGAVKSMSLSPGTSRHEIVMVGDDLLGDIHGAQQAGLLGYLVKTGKYQEERLARSGIRPDRILQSVADLVES